MPLEGRAATDADILELEGFRCAMSAVSHQVEVETFFRRDADAFRQRLEARLIVFRENGIIKAVGGHYLWQPPQRRWLSAIGVDCDCQGDGIGPDVFRALRDDAARLNPCGDLSWMVHKDNEPCIKMCADLGYGESWLLDDDYRVYTIDLPA